MLKLTNPCEPETLLNWSHLKLFLRTIEKHKEHFIIPYFAAEPFLQLILLKRKKNSSRMPMKRGLTCFMDEIKSICIHMNDTNRVILSENFIHFIEQSFDFHRIYWLVNWMKCSIQLNHPMPLKFRDKLEFAFYFILTISP